MSGSAKKSSSKGSAARRVAIKAMVRIESDGGYANLVLGPLLERSSLDDRDKGFVTELVYGTTRMKRACDYLVDRFVIGDVDPQVRAALRIGAYQLHFLEMASHAAVGATVGAVRGPGRGMVNAVLRKVAKAPVEWPSDGIRLSYPDWIIKSLAAEHGRETTLSWLEAMNERPVTHARDDGYVQDLASQEVVRLTGARSGERVLDLCAAPGGKATGLANDGAFVVASDLRPSRVSILAANVERLGADVATLVADGRNMPFADASFDRVLLDAPCSGMGSLRRRADARWRIDVLAPQRLAELQLELLTSARRLVKPGGELVYSVCTLTREETSGVVEGFLVTNPTVEVAAELTIMPPIETDGMAMARFLVPH